MGRNGGNGDDDNVVEGPFTEEALAELERANDDLARELGFNVPESDPPDSAS